MTAYDHIYLTNEYKRLRLLENGLLNYCGGIEKIRHDLYISIISTPELPQNVKDTISATIVFLNAVTKTEFLTKE